MAIIVYVVSSANEMPLSDEVVVNGPTFRSVALTPPVPIPATRPGARDAAATGGNETKDPARFADQVSVVRAVQQQLKRAGCYSGRVTGVWSPSTRKAMAAFTVVVNARLPVNRADPVLLVLIDSNPAAQCSPACAKDGGEACGAPAAAPEPEMAALEDDRADAPAERAAEDQVEAVASEPAQPANRAEATPSEPRELAAVEPAPEASDPSIETAALPAAAAISRKAARSDRPRVARRYKKQSSFSRQVSKGFKSLQRSLNKLF